MMLGIPDPILGFMILGYKAQPAGETSDFELTFCHIKRPF